MLRMVRNQDSSDVCPIVETGRRIYGLFLTSEGHIYGEIFNRDSNESRLYLFVAFLFALNDRITTSEKAKGNEVAAPFPVCR